MEKKYRTVYGVVRQTGERIILGTEMMDDNDGKEILEVFASCYMGNKPGFVRIQSNVWDAQAFMGVIIDPQIDFNNV